MDRRHKCSRALPHTTKVNDKSMEYCQKFGKDRDLEKFMRIYSPVLEGCCQRARPETTSSSEALSLMPSFPLNGCGVNSKSMPNIETTQFACKDVIVDINIELEDDNGKIFSASTENIQTPKKGPHGDTMQTPESVAKTHRRLEWDSLGDIGYRKSMSTSNVSVLERSLLKEFFKENTNTSEPSTTHKEESAPQRKSHEEQHKNVKTLKANVAEHATPPLASSTMVEGLSGKAANRGARPKMVSQSTSSTSLQKKFEKYAQTSLLQPAKTHSQEIQVCMSSSTSVIGEGTATPSSFEYYSSRSSKSRSTRSSIGVSSNISNASIPQAQHPFITSITDLLKKRKAMNKNTVEERNHCDSIRELQSKFQAAMEENKENQSHTNTASSTATSSVSLANKAPELDLGIQLICSLIDAKSVNGKQKKKLIRDIVKRITRLNGDEDLEQSNGSCYPTQTSASSEKQNVYDAVYSRRRNGPLTSNNVWTNVPTNEAGVTPIQTGDSINPEIVKHKNYVSTPTINSTNEGVPKNHDYPTKSREVSGKHTKSKNTQQKILGNSNLRSPGTKSKKQLPPSKATNENHNIVSNLSSLVTQKRSKGMQSELIAMPRNTAGGNDSNEADNYLHGIRTTRSTQTIKSTASTELNKLPLSSSTRTTSSGATTTSSSSSHDLPTQKSLRKTINNRSADGDQATMREWLNPLTQSEIEYEEKKREESVKKPVAAEALKNEKNSKKSKHDCGRVQQLNWIDNEIHRLECLKHLLLKDDNEKSSIVQSQSTTESTSKLKESNNSTQTDKLYDTVYSDKSSVLSESAERLVKEIEVILEESCEDVINLEDNTKSNKERKKETKIVYEKHAGSKGETEKCNRAKLRTMKETITVNEEQMWTNKVVKSNLPAPTGQRQKIDTPTSDQGTESLRDMVKQRKRDFMESYKTKKQNHYDALKQQQKQQNKFRYLPIKEVHISKEKHPTQTYPGCYSVPHTINRRFSPTEYAYPQSNLPPTPEENHIQTQIEYSTPASYNHIRKEQNVTSASSTNAATTTTTSSSTSMFCISSDVSVPMGSNNGSSTPTTTHHYDDVAAAVAGVAVQTSDSILRSQPIFGPQLYPYFCSKRSQPTSFILQPKISNTTAIHVKPKGIAYVIEFDDNKDVIENSKESEIKLNVEANANTFTTNIIQGFQKASSEPQMTLQDHLERAKPKFLQHTKERKAILNKLQAMRQARDRQLREIIDNTSFNSLERRLKYLPPPPIQKIRILKTKEMKALTNKRVASLPEVVARKEQEKEEKKRRGNRILRDVFNRRLQRRVRNGKLSLNHSKTVI